MNLEKLFSDKSFKAKQKVEALSKMLLDKKLAIKGLINFAKTLKDSDKATCIEALEFATKAKPEIANADCLKFVSDTLSETAPRIKWESAKVIGNIAHLFPGKLDPAIKHLLTNSEHSGTVVRWSAAYALGQILKTKQKGTKELMYAVEAICKREEKSSIKKIYIEGLKTIS